MLIWYGFGQFFPLPMGHTMKMHMLKQTAKILIDSAQKMSCKHSLAMKKLWFVEQFLEIPIKYANE